MTLVAVALACAKAALDDVNIYNGVRLMPVAGLVTALAVGIVLRRTCEYLWASAIALAPCLWYFWSQQWFPASP